MPPHSAFASVPPALGLALTLALAACGPVGPSGQSGGPAPAAAKPATAAGYLAPPGLGAAVRSPAGLTLSGQAPGGSLVRLASPEGVMLTATAGADGRWSLTLPAPISPAMFALSAQTGQRTLRAEGAVLALPEPGPPALLVRAGFAAEPLGRATASPAIIAVDYDSGGGAAVAGLAKGMERVRLSIDGVAAGLGQADEDGHFAVLAANQTLAAGGRRLLIETDSGRAEVVVQVSRPALLGDAAYRAARQDSGWRIDWSPAGGGVQTTVVFDSPQPQAGSPTP